MDIYRLTYDWRHDGGDDWEEIVVFAESEEDAYMVSGYLAFPKEHTSCELLGTAVDGEERGLVCSGIHKYPPFELGEKVKLSLSFFPGAEAGAVGEVIDVKYENHRKYIKIKWDKDNPKWNGQEDSFYNASWFDYPWEDSPWDDELELPFDKLEDKGEPLEVKDVES
jgi:hypothetical protein